MEWADICVSWYDALQETQHHLSGDAVKNAKSEFNYEETSDKPKYAPALNTLHAQNGVSWLLLK